MLSLKSGGHDIWQMKDVLNATRTSELTTFSLPEDDDTDIF
jgi:hypothetical protein